MPWICPNNPEHKEFIGGDREVQCWDCGALAEMEGGSVVDPQDVADMISGRAEGLLGDDGPDEEVAAELASAILEWFQERNSAAKPLERSHCPKCGHDDPTGEFVSIEGSYARQECTCTECETRWNDWYTYGGAKVLWEFEHGGH